MSPKTTQPRDRRLRLYHRLVGLLVLGALAVILVPMILDFRTDQETAITRSNIPERPDGYRMEEISLLSPGEQVPVVANPGAVTGEGVPPPASEPTAQAAADPQAWVVRVGSFSSADNAIALRDQLRAKGFRAFVDEVQVDGRVMSRVQVGPEIQRARGEELRDRIAREMNLESLVVGYN